jgi:tyrosyl-tRNA synthetase
MSPAEQLTAMKARTEKFIGGEDILKRLEAGKTLRVKLGVDPTRPDLTFGHMVVLNKLRQFQDLGHQAVLIIGDYTTRIGDPTGRSDTRPVLTEAEIEFFAKRYDSKTPISIVEFLYPLLQGHDSVMLKADLEIGGSDQLFNMMVGRDLQEQAGQAPQAVLGMPLLVGLDGEKKMSKSLGNYISFNHNPKDIFGKVMSVPDATMWVYYRLLLELSEDEIRGLKAQHPMEMKKQLATRLTDKFHGDGAGAKERAEFENVFSKGGVRSDMPEFAWAALSGGAAEAGIVDLLAATNLFPSKKEIRRLIEGGAVKIGDEKVADPALKVAQPSGELVIQAGKRTFVKVK